MKSRYGYRKREAVPRLHPGGLQLRVGGGVPVSGRPSAGGVRTVLDPDPPSEREGGAGRLYLGGLELSRVACAMRVVVITFL